MLRIRPKRKQFLLKNNFHNTEITLFAAKTPLPDTYQISAQQVKKAREALCGIEGCACGGFAGERGPNRFIVEGRADGGAWILERKWM